MRHGRWWKQKSYHEENRESWYFHHLGLRRWVRAPWRDQGAKRMLLPRRGIGKKYFRTALFKYWHPMPNPHKEDRRTPAAERNRVQVVSGSMQGAWAREEGSPQFPEDRERHHQILPRPARQSYQLTQLCLYHTNRLPQQDQERDDGAAVKISQQCPPLIFYWLIFTNSIVSCSYIYESMRKLLI